MNIEQKAKTAGTLRNYVSYARNWVKYCISIGCHPAQFPLDPTLVLMWIGNLAKNKPTVVSIGSWISALTWWSECLGAGSDNWKQDLAFRSFKRQLIRQKGAGNDVRLPFSLQDIINYTIYKRVVPGNFFKVSYDALDDVMVLQLMFVTMSRPSELINAPYSKDCNGLLCKDIKFIRQGPTKHFKIAILHYKNQEFKGVAKTIYLASSKMNCSDRHCRCRVFNPFQLLYLYIKRRTALINSVADKHWRRDISFAPHNKFFLKRDGREITTSSARRIIRELVEVNQLLEPNLYKEYSVRMGGATHCSLQAIPHEIIQAYVIWSRNQMQCASTGYIRPRPELLLKLSSMMIHGFVTEAGQRLTNDKPAGYVYNPWAKNNKRRH